MTLVVCTTIAPPCVIHESGDVSSTVGWVGVIEVGKHLFAGITVEEIDVHGVCLGILRKTAIPDKRRPLVLVNCGIGCRVTGKDVVSGKDLTVLFCLVYSLLIWD